VFPLLPMPLTVGRNFRYVSSFFFEVYIFQHVMKSYRDTLQCNLMTRPTIHYVFIWRQGRQV